MQNAKQTVQLLWQLAATCCSMQEQVVATAVAADVDLTVPSPWDFDFLHCLRCSFQVEWVEVAPHHHRSLLSHSHSHYHLYQC